MYDCIYHGLEAGSRTHDGHVHYVYQNEAFLKNTQLRRGTSQVDKTENGKLPAVKGKPACARVNVHRLHLVGLEIATFGAPFAYMRIYGVYGVGTSKQSVRTCSCVCLCAGRGQLAVFELLVVNFSSGKYPPRGDSGLARVVPG